MKIEVIPVAEEEKSVLANLVQLYLYDFSELRAYDVTPHGTFGYPFLDHYFVEDDREAFFIHVDGVLAGFTMTRRLDDGAREMSEFFVLRRHRRRGTGTAAAHKTFRRHPGPWVLAFDHANHAAVRFWRSVVAEAAQGPVHSEDRYPPQVGYAGTWLRFRIGASPSLQTVSATERR